MKIIGLTGPSGTGKSTVAKCACSLGYSVIDCDKVAASVTDDAELLNRLEAAFGGVVKNGSLDRKALAHKAFAAIEQTEKLNRIMLPIIVNAIKKQINELNKAGVTHLLLDAPTLYESGLDADCDTIIAVLADKEHRAERISERDRLTKEQLEKRLNAAKPDTFYLQKAEHIIYNNGDLSELESSAIKLINSL